MSALTTTTNRTQIATTASALCTPALWRRLTDASVSWADACERLAADPNASAELMTVSDELQRAIEPTSPHAIIQILAPLMTLYGVPRKSEAEAEAFWGFYMDALGNLPAEAVRAGAADYVSDAKSEWFPKPGPLKALCERHAIPLRMAASRARKAVELVQQVRVKGRAA